MEYVSPIQSPVFSQQTALSGLDHMILKLGMIKSVYLVVPVVKLFSTRLAAEVPADSVYLFGDRFLTHLGAVVASDTLQAQTPGKILLEQ